MINVLPAIESLILLRDKTCAEFVRAIGLIQTLEKEIYAKSGERGGGGSVGAHFRHNIDFAENFLKGLEAGKIDFASRERDERIEQEPELAIRRIETIVRRLRQLSPAVLETNIAVRSEIDDTLCHFSSVSRELEFLHSHTVHHHALIAEKLKSFRLETSPDFGVAPSTLKFWAEGLNIKNR